MSETETGHQERHEATVAALTEARAELSRLRGVVEAVQECADMIEGDSGVAHNYGCEGEPTCLACIVDSLRYLLAPVSSSGEAESGETVIDAAHIERQRQWSMRTFGPGARLLGVLDHIRKELREIEAAPADVEEWVDVLILAFDGAWRAGWEPQQILDAIVAKQTKNEGRSWPDWRGRSEDEAIEHVRDDDPGCTVCGRDNRNGTHMALEMTGHLSHPFTPAPASSGGQVDGEGAVGCTCQHYVVDYSDPERYHDENVDREDDPNCPVHGRGQADGEGEGGPDRDVLSKAVIDVCWKATQYGTTEDGDTLAYILPKGAIHRLVGAAQGAGVPAALRAAGVPAPEDEPAARPVLSREALRARLDGHWTIFGDTCDCGWSCDPKRGSRIDQYRDHLIDGLYPEDGER